MLTAPTSLLATRLSRVRAAVAAKGLDALVVTHLPNLAYLANFDGSAGIGVVEGRRLYLLSDFRYSSAVLDLLASPATPPDVDFVPVEGSYEETLAGLVERTGWRVLGLESASVSLKRAEWWRQRLGAVSLGERDGVPSEGRALVATDGLVERCRMVKDDHEVGALREGARRLSAAARDVLTDAVRPGRRETDIAADIDARMKVAGFSRPAFETIVASGPNSAYPHARPTERVIVTGDLVVLDFGGVYQGYCVDLTRTVAMGRPSDDARRIYRLVHEARDRAIAAVRPGAMPHDVDAAARDHLAANGLGEAFGHGTGHGLGLEVHEDPRVGKLRGDGAPVWPLEAGVVCTIEPGAYVPGIGGVRLEDDVLVTPDGCEVLTDVPFDAILDE